jgi:hypothetical protein
VSGGRACLGCGLYYEATKVEANVGISSLAPRFNLDAKTHVADLFADDDEDASVLAADDLPPGIVRLPMAPDAERVPLAWIIHEGGR